MQLRLNDTDPKTTLKMLVVTLQQRMDGMEADHKAAESAFRNKLAALNEDAIRREQEIVRDLEVIRQQATDITGRHDKKSLLKALTSLTNKLEK